MHQYKKKHKVVFVDTDIKPSPHKVDLFQIEKERERREAKSRDNSTSAWYDYFEELGIIALCNKCKAFYTSLKLFRPNNKKVSRLAFYGALKAIILFAAKLIGLFADCCYRIGWIAVFCLRFVCVLAVWFLKSFSRFRKVSAGFIAIIRRDKKTQQNIRHVISEYKHNPADRPAIGGRYPGEKNDAARSKKSSYTKTSSLLNDIRSFFLRKHAIRPAIFLAAAFFILILPLKAFSEFHNLFDLRGRVLGASERAVKDMMGASGEIAGLDFNSATEKFSRASSNFSKAKEDIRHISGILSLIKGIIPREEVQMGANASSVLSAGQLSAQAGREMSLALASLEMKSGNPDAKRIINDFHSHISLANDYIAEMRMEISRIEPQALPAEYRDNFSELKIKSVAIISSLNRLEQLLADAKTFLGFEYDKRYLLVFQNNAEIRAGGGFIGSYALVDFRNGRIKNLEVPGGGSYDTEGGLHKLVEAPKPLRLLRPLWHFWDANWWPDWKMSARKLMWFMEKSRGPTVDGVIGVTPTTVERFIKIIGPIDMEDEYGITFTEENFWQETQKLAERKSNVTNKPKDIIGHLMEALIKKLRSDIDREKLFRLVVAAEQSMAEKHVLFYFTDNGLQSSVEEMDWAGRVKDTEWDYLQVVNSNIGGQKSDKVISQDIHHKADVKPDGTVVNTLRIRRRHNGALGEEFTGARNVDWMRVYVPEGSRLLDASGFEAPPEELFEGVPEAAEADPDVASTEGRAKTHSGSDTLIYEDSGKTVFANWVQVDPGKTVSIRLRYELPFKLAPGEAPDGFFSRISGFMNPYKKQPIPYALLVQKQPGAKSSQFRSVLSLSENFKKIWQYPEDNISDNKEGWRISNSLSSDQYQAALLISN